MLSVVMLFNHGVERMMQLLSVVPKTAKHVKRDDCWQCLKRRKLIFLGVFFNMAEELVGEGLQHDRTEF